MRKFIAVFIVYIFLLSQTWAQALAVGKVMMTGDVNVTGPGKVVYTAREGTAPLFPGSVVKVGKGKAVVTLAGKGSVTANENSVLIVTKKGVLDLKPGVYQVKVLPGQEMKVITPKGELLFKSPPDKASLFSLKITENQVEAMGSGVIFAGGRTIPAGGTLLLGTSGSIATAAPTALYIGLAASAVAGATMAVAINSSTDEREHHPSPSSP